MFQSLPHTQNGGHGGGGGATGLCEEMKDNPWPMFAPFHFFKEFGPSSGTARTIAIWVMAPPGDGRERDGGGRAESIVADTSKDEQQQKMIQRAQDDCRSRKYRNRMSIMQRYFMDGHIKFKVGDCAVRRLSGDGIYGNFGKHKIE